MKHLVKRASLFTVSCLLPLVLAGCATKPQSAMHAHYHTVNKPTHIYHQLNNAELLGMNSLVNNYDFDLTGDDDESNFVYGPRVKTFHHHILYIQLGGYQDFHRYNYLKDYAKNSSVDKHDKSFVHAKFRNDDLSLVRNTSKNVPTETLLCIKYHLHAVYKSGNYKQFIFYPYSIYRKNNNIQKIQHPKKYALRIIKIGNIVSKR